VDFSVTDNSGADQALAPVYVGVPLPPSSPSAVESFRVLDPSGIAISADIRPLARWNGAPDDVRQPLRWVGVTFQTDLRAGERRTFTLEAHDGVVAPDARPVARDDADGVRFDTGLLSFRLPKHGSAVIDDVRADLDGIPGTDVELVAPEHGGGLLAASIGSSSRRWETVGVTLLEAGRMRAAARIDLAPPAGGGGATIWVTAHRGLPGARLRIAIHGAGEASQPAALVLPIRTLGDPLQLGVRRDVEGEVLEGPLPPAATLHVRRENDGWEAVLGDIRADGVIPWVQLSSISWSTAVATRGEGTSLQAAGNGTLRVDLAPSEGAGAVGAEIYFEARGPRQTRSGLTAFHAPASAHVSASWYDRTMAGGPEAAAPKPVRLPVHGAWDPALAHSLRFLASGDTATLEAARQAADNFFADPSQRGLAGPALYAFLSGDPAAIDAIRRHVSAGQVDTGVPVGWQVLDALVAWELTGVVPRLEFARASLRAGIGAAWRADACRSSAAAPAEIAVLVEAAGRFAWTTRVRGARDEAAENALFGMLARLENCPPEHPAWADAWAYGAILTADREQSERWTALAEAALAHLDDAGYLADQSLHGRAGRALGWLHDRTRPQRAQ
jgi:hypothetical protein